MSFDTGLRGQFDGYDTTEEEYFEGMTEFLDSKSKCDDTCVEGYFK